VVLRVDFGCPDTLGPPGASTPAEPASATPTPPVATPPTFPLLLTLALLIEFGAQRPVAVNTPTVHPPIGNGGGDRTVGLGVMHAVRIPTGR